MPEVAHEHDAEWIKEQLNKLPPQMRYKAVSGYDGVYNDAFEAETTAHKRSNAARRAANLRLRIFVDKFYKAAMGHTIKPPISK
jgi:hypothetical protein